MRKVRFDARSILSVLLIIVLLAGIVALCISLFGNGRKSITTFAFTTGAIDASGNYRSSETSLCTKEMFECQELTISRVFNSAATYQVFYYREDDSYIGCTTVMSDTFYDKGLTFSNAKYARVVINPKLEEKEKVSFWNKSGFINDFKITVSKKQDFEAPLVSVFSDVREKYVTDITGTSYAAVRVADSPFVISNISSLTSKTVKKISIPICGVIDANEDSIFTFYVVEGTGSGNFKKVSMHEMKIPAGTFVSSSGKIDPFDNEVKNGANVAWFEFDVNIHLKTNQTLAFGSPNDTAYFVYRKGFTKSNNHYDIYNTAFNNPSLLETISIYVDIKVLE